MIRFDHVTKRYPNGREALRAATFSIDRGEMVFLTGRSGRRQEQRAQADRAARTPDARHGRRQWPESRARSNRATSRVPPQPRRRVPGSRLLDDRPVFDNVALPLIVAGAGQTRSTSACARRSIRWACWARSACCPSSSRSGEQQRVGIARAVVAKPALLIADEPTGNLDPALAARSHEAVQALPGSRRDGGHRDP